MTNRHNLTTFNGKPVRDFDPEEGINLKYCYRLRLDYDDFEDGVSLSDIFVKFASDKTHQK